MDNYQQVIAYGLGTLVVLVVIYLIWPYLVGFLAVVGAVQIYRWWKQQKPS